MKLRYLLGAVLATACWTTMPAFADDAAARGDSANSPAATGATGDADREFNKLDKNKDGYISRDEAKGSDHAKDFSKYDKNKDGKLSKEEFSAAERAEDAASGGTHKDKDQDND